MWTTPSVKIGVLTLTVVMLFTAAEVDSYILMNKDCCEEVKGHGPIEDIRQCYEQKKRRDCQYHAFVIKTNSNKMFCVKPTPPWLKDLINTGALPCPPEFIITKLRKRFEVLDEDDLE